MSNDVDIFKEGSSRGILPNNKGKEKMARKAVTVEHVMPEFHKAKHLLGDVHLMESPDPSKVILICNGRGKEYSCQALKSNLAFLVEVANGRNFRNEEEDDLASELSEHLDIDDDEALTG